MIDKPRTEIERLVEFSVPGRKYRLVSDDDYLAQIDERYEPDMVALFASVVSAPDQVLDIGANIGCTSILFGELAKRVVSFEPSPSTFRFLRRNISDSGLTNIDLQNYGLGSAAARLKIMFSGASRAGAFVANHAKASEGHITEDIEIQRLDDVFAHLPVPRVDFIKIDVEGFEIFVIDGAAKTIGQFRPVVVLEMNHWCLNVFQRISIPDFLDFLRQRFPILLAVDGGTYANLHDAGESYEVMYHHVIHFKYANLVAAFDANQLSRFYQRHRHCRA